MYAGLFSNKNDTFATTGWEIINCDRDFNFNSLAKRIETVVLLLKYTILKNVEVFV